MTESHPIVQALYDWWPALILLIVAYQGLRFLSRAFRGKGKKLDGMAYDVHQITTTLGCTEHQARALLSTYNGSAAKAINEVKTGRAVLPGSQFKELARYVGDAKSFVFGESELTLITRKEDKFSLSPAGPGLLVLGVVDPEGRPGSGRADRGELYAQLFWKEKEDWMRFLLDSRRLDYFVLGERKQNIAVRNFKTVLEDLIQHASGLQLDPSVHAFMAEFNAPVYRKLADLDAAAADALRNLQSEGKPLS